MFMKVSNLRTKEENTYIKVLVNVDSPNVSEEQLYFKVDKKNIDKFTLYRYDAFLIGLLYPAMRHKENIHIDGSITLDLYENLENIVIPLLSEFYSDTKKITVSADSLVLRTISGGGRYWI